MSEAAFNDDLLEKELFGGDSDELDMDEMMSMGLDSDVKTADPVPTTVTPKVPLEELAKSKELANTTETKAKEPRLQAAVPKLDIELDDPPGELTILERVPRKHTQVAPGYDTCKTYDVLPTMAFLNQYQIHAVAAVSNMRWVFTGGEDGYIKKWDFNATVNGKQMLTLGQRHAHVDSVAKSGTMASYWDHNDVNESGNEFLSPVYSIDVHSEAMWLVSGMKSGNIGLWTVRHDEGRRIALLSKHKKPVSVLRISPDEFGLVSGSWDRAVLYWDLNTGKISRAFAGHISQVSSIEFQPCLAEPSESADKRASPLLMTTSIDGQCLLWDMRAPEALPQAFLPPKKTPPWATSACWSRDGQRIYIGRRNNTVDEYEVGAGPQPTRTLKLPMNSGPVTALSMMGNNRSLVCASTDNVRMWDLEMSTDRRSSVPFQIIPGHHGGTISSVFIDESSRYMLTTSGNRGWDGSSNNVFLGYEITPI
ncbi:Transcription factor spt8 [Coemansia sp. RSA 989]|nr:WD40-repeat-containing domain protein [Coemansia mojavensis]KAJ1742548.1 Transcription factor spt8 [Coemansia sp. RSA 1086]KAJ1860518.1 Transcription factor spt8 [Coemansia sp. RSA 989]KAJ1874118.1 Transcription factor spt8 [Coemansia sp. RSA 990]KAJ2628964.1 Transcription factor spt8 [Coemansia sp. RSA 1290]KAJ2653348.1 Transcription factor spt8 [Coemansia sp. RSA 1250]KAJ2670691.1 Transcription factor spt8 [Coemansia sp. RSA 1085]